MVLLYVKNGKVSLILDAAGNGKAFAPYSPEPASSAPVDPPLILVRPARSLECLTIRRPREGADNAPAFSVPVEVGNAKCGR